MLKAAVTLALLAGCPALAQELECRVLDDATGHPIAAELRLHKPGVHELAANLDTGRDGLVRISGLAAGQYNLEVVKANYITASLPVVIPVRDLTVRLVRYAVISGHVRDSNGKPVIGRVITPYGRTSGSARIAVLVKAPGRDQLSAVRQQPLGNDGTFRVFDLPPGQYAIGLWYAGLDVGSGVQMYPRISQPQFFSISGGEEYRDVDFTIVAGPAYSISGKVDLPDPKTTYSLALTLPEQPALPIGQTVTESDGSFRFNKIPSGAYDLFAGGPEGGYGAFENVLARGKDPYFGRLRVQIGGEDVTGLNLAVRPGQSAAIILRGPDNSAKSPDGCPASASVGATLTEAWGLMINASAQATFEKEQTLRALPPARFQLTAGGLPGGCYQVNQPTLDLTGGDNSTPVVVQLASAGRINGALAAPGQKNTWTIVLLPVDSSADSQALLARPDDQGNFVFEGLKPGRYRIAARGPGLASRWIADVKTMDELEVAGGAVTQVVLPKPSQGGVR